MQCLLAIVLLPQRVAGWTAAVLGIVAVILAAVGLHALMALLVTQRRNELALRMALGAMPRELFRDIAIKGFGLTLLGLATGLAVGMGVIRFLGGFLLDVGSFDPGSLAVPVLVSNEPAYLETFQGSKAQELPLHSHDEVHLCFVLQGRLYERHGATDIPLGPGSMRLSPPGDAHRIRFGPQGADCALIFFSGGLLDDLSLKPPQGRLFSEMEQSERHSLGGSLQENEGALRMLSLQELAAVRRIGALAKAGPGPDVDLLGYRL